MSPIQCRCAKASMTVLKVSTWSMPRSVQKKGWMLRQAENSQRRLVVASAPHNRKAFP